MISRFKRLWSDTSGNALMLAGAAMPLVVGCAGLRTAGLARRAGAGHGLALLRLGQVGRRRTLGLRHPGRVRTQRVGRGAAAGQQHQREHRDQGAPGTAHAASLPAGP